METSQRAQRSDGLRHGAVGMWDLVFFVVAAAAPLSVMSGVSPLAIGFGGVTAPGGYLTGGIVMAIFAVGFIPALGVFAHDTLDSLFGLDLPWGLWAVIGGAVVAALGYLNVTLSAKVLGLLLGLEVLILLVFAVPVLLQGRRRGLELRLLQPGRYVRPRRRRSLRPVVRRVPRIRVDRDLQRGGARSHANGRTARRTSRSPRRAPIRRTCSSPQPRTGSAHPRAT